MKSKRIIALCLSCAVVIACLSIRADADDICQPEMHMEDMECEQIDLNSIDVLEDSSLLRGADSVSGSVAAYSASVGNRVFYLSSGSTITFNCSYSPSPASMDFGVIAPDGKFYYVNVKEGSINQPIRVNQTGDYSVAIRNNSSQTVSVVGFVEY